MAGQGGGGYNIPVSFANSTSVPQGLQSPTVFAFSSPGSQYNLGGLSLPSTSTATATTSEGAKAGGSNSETASNGSSLAADGGDALWLKVAAGVSVIGTIATLFFLFHKKG